jgi:hypothetical protein
VCHMILIFDYIFLIGQLRNKTGKKMIHKRIF